MKPKHQHRIVLIAALAASAFAGAPAVAAQMTPGLWEYTTKIDMPGMAMPPHTAQQCMKAADVSDTRKTLPIDKHCETSDVKYEGNTVSWKMRCDAPQAMTGSGSMTQEATRSSGTVKMSMQGMNVTSHIEGKRIGDCAQ